MEALSHMINREAEKGLWTGIHFSPYGPKINHLLFTDDSLFILKATAEEVSSFGSVMDMYSKASGQRINFSKSAITFGNKVSDAMKTLIRDSTGIRQEGGTGMYLGLPECFSGSKKQMLGFLHDRLKAKMSNWFAKTLSSGGKETLLKAVTTALPVHAMSCFRLPRASCKTLSATMANFWWNSQEDQRKIHWKSWSKMCLDKELGGIGFKDIECFNKALLAKQSWRLIQDPQSLLARLFQSRYHKQSTFLEANMGTRPSSGWRSIIYGRELLKEGIGINVGNGKSINVWMDPWLNYHPPRPPWRKNIMININQTVDCLIDSVSQKWKMQVLDDLFYEQDKEHTLKLTPLPLEDDYWTWRYTKSGSYSVKSGYELALEYYRKPILHEARARPSLADLQAQVLTIKTLLKIRIFIWKAISNCLPVKEHLNSRGLKIDLICQACSAPIESINHVLFSCPPARQLWAMSNIPIPRAGYDALSFPSNLHHVLNQMQNERIPIIFRRSIPWLMWLMWKNRNVGIFTGSIFLASNTISKSIAEAEAWFEAQQIDRDDLDNISRRQQANNIKWTHPPIGWMKCNIAFAGDKNLKRGGSAWILRDSNGQVLLHARRRFTQIKDSMDLKCRTIQWAIDSMSDHHQNRIIFQMDAADLVNAILQPRAWPSFKTISSSLLQSLSQIQWWRIESGANASNTAATRLARSVTDQNRWRSYIATGAPSWLIPVLQEESSDL